MWNKDVLNFMEKIKVEIIKTKIKMTQSKKQALLLEKQVYKVYLKALRRKKKALN